MHSSLQGNKYWRLTKFRLDPGYPKLMSEGFRGIPSNVDAAFRWTGNGKIYFFKGDRYWRFDPSRTSQPVSSSYPQPISNWGDLPNNLDAAVTYSNGRTYFFKKGYYYRFDNAKFKVGSSGLETPFSDNAFIGVNAFRHAEGISWDLSNCVSVKRG